MSIFDDIGSIITGPADVVNETIDFLKLAAWLVNPFNWLRMVEFVTGFVFMLMGMWALVSSSRSPTLASTGAGIARVTRAVGAATPAGRVMRERKGRRMGTREGQREAARMEARRKATRKEREASARERHGRERRAREHARRPSHA